MAEELDVGEDYFKRPDPLAFLLDTTKTWRFKSGVDFPKGGKAKNFAHKLKSWAGKTVDIGVMVKIDEKANTVDARCFYLDEEQIAKREKNRAYGQLGIAARLAKKELP